MITHGLLLAPPSSAQGKSAEVFLQGMHFGLGNIAKLGWDADHPQRKRPGDRRNADRVFDSGYFSLLGTLYSRLLYMKLRDLDESFLFEIPYYNESECALLPLFPYIPVHKSIQCTASFCA